MAQYVLKLEQVLVEVVVADGKRVPNHMQGDLSFDPSIILYCLKHSSDSLCAAKGLGILGSIRKQQIAF